MASLYRFIRSFFGFSRGQTNGFIILIPLLFILLFSRTIYFRWIFHPPDHLKKDQHILDSLVAIIEQHKVTIPRDEEVTLKPFMFNPNDVTSSNLQAMGFNKRLSERIVRYREKGGVFKVKKDLMKIYGVDTSLYQKFYQYINLPDELQAKRQDREHYTKTQYEKVKNDINQADTAQLKDIYGIGDKLALRIVRYREKLGGFVDLAQIKEVYGLDSAVVKRVMASYYVADDFRPLQLNINELPAEVMAAHPYIGKQAAIAMVAYRFQHGRFSSLEELAHIQSLSPEAIRKMKPYLKLAD
jgi:competence ComEA-like helix-hairpin-helix protein